MAVAFLVGIETKIEEGWLARGLISGARNNVSPISGARKDGSSASDEEALRN
jgi:hypothetical protein